MNKKQKFCLFLSIFFIVIIISEIFYRRPLYDLSVKYISQIKQEGFFHNFYIFWSNYYLTIINISGILITNLFFPLHVFYSHISAQAISGSFNGLLKSIYSNERPYWDIYIQNDSKNIQLPKPTECTLGFGNPSGHSMSSTYILYLWNLFICSNFFNKMKGKKKIIIKYATLILSIISIILVTYSRINRQVHSFNQIIYGTLLGTAIFLFFCYTIKINTINSEEFIKILNKYKFFAIPLFFVLYITSLIIGLTRHNDNEEQYQYILSKYCNASDNLFKNKRPYTSSRIFQVIGGYIGLLLLNNKINKYYKNLENRFFNWNKGGKLKTFKIFIFCFGLSSIHLLVPNFISISSYFYVYFVLSIIVNFFVGLFSMDIYFYYACELFLVDKHVDISTDNPLIGSEENKKNNNE